MNTRIITAVAAMAVAALTARSQDINTEVVVERTVQPVERAATRPLSLVPGLQLPAPQPVTLSTARYTELSPLQRGFTRLQPAPGEALPAPSPYRGYVSAGYFPVYNLGVAAGYRVMADSLMSLDIHGVFDGYSYRPWQDADNSYSYNGVTVGADYSMSVGSRSRLDAGLDYTYASTGTWFRDAQSRNAFTLGLRWQSSLRGLDYEAWGRVAVDAFGQADFARLPRPAVIDGLKEQRYTLGGHASLALGDEVGVEARVKGDFLHSDASPEMGGDNTTGIISVDPGLYYHSDNVTARAGVNLDFYTGGYESTLHIAPEVELVWRPMAALALRASATGDAGFNTARDALDISPLLAAVAGYGRGHLPLDLTGAIVMGPLAGFTATLEGGYAKADNVLTVGGDSYTSPLAVTDLKGWHTRVALGYEHRIFDIHASAAAASSDMASGRGYYRWNDGARYVVTAGAAVKPIRSLSIGVDYELRARRRSAFISLGTTSQLAARACYAFTPAFDVFVNVENILDRRETVVAGIREQGVHGLVGVTCKF